MFRCRVVVFLWGVFNPSSSPSKAEHAKPCCKRKMLLGACVDALTLHSFSMTSVHLSEFLHAFPNFAGDVAKLVHTNCNHCVKACFWSFVMRGAGAAMILMPSASQHTRRSSLAGAMLENACTHLVCTASCLRKDRRASRMTFMIKQPGQLAAGSNTLLVEDDLPSYYKYYILDLHCSSC